MQDAEGLAALREAFDQRPEITEKRMFGGQFFMLNGNMLCGIGKYGFMFRVGPDNEAAALDLPGTRPVIQAGRVKPGFVHAEPNTALAAGIGQWIALAEAYVAPLPAKEG